MGVKTELPPAPAEAPEPLAASLCWLLSRASWILTTELTAALERVGIPPRSHHVLATAMTGAHTQTELARLVGVDKTTMVVTLDELEAAGLAERRPSPEDRRARVIVVTEAGRRVVREGEAIVRRIQEDVLATLRDDEREAFLSALAKLVCQRLVEPALTAAPVRRRAGK
jgi:MarR family transcriptional regulator for hemolysin